MQQKIQQFVFISERLLSESGELRSRRSWKELQNISTQLEPHMVQLTQSFDPKYALLFLLSCNNIGNNTNQKNSLFSMVFSRILSRIPNEDILNLLSSISRVDLNTFLLPFLYDKGDIGSVATYVSAKLGLKIQTDSVEFFLTIREWTQEDLINLSFLVLNDEKDSLIMNLDSSFNENLKEVYGQFLNVLNASNIKEPIIPTIQSIERIEDENKLTTTQTKNKIPTPNSFLQKLPSNQNYKYKIPGLNRQSSSVTNQISNQNDGKNDSSLFNKQSVNTNTNINNKIKSSPQNTINSQVNNLPTSSDIIINNEQQNKTSVYSVLAKPGAIQNSDQKQDQEKQQKNEDNNKPVNSNIETKSETNNINISDNIKEKLSSFDFSSNLEMLKTPTFIISIVIILVGILYLLISNSSNSKVEKKEIIKAPSKVGKLPEYWIDAITNKKITPRYLQADVDYRMGELYLTRNKYVEAISFYQSALKIEPKHHLSKMKWGYSELMQGNYLEADKLLNEVRKADSKIPNLNLYLARNYFAQKKYDKAEKSYLDEYNLTNSLSVGMEYANFLAKSGDMDRAMSFLASLQSKNPGKMLVLDSKNLNSDNNQKQNNKK